MERVAAAAGVPCRVDVHEDEERITAVCTGPDLGLLIGRHGQTIDALQYLANAITARRGDGPRKQVVVDAAGYRERRREVLEALAVRSAEQAIASGERVELEPMTAVERKVVHLRLEGYSGVETTSEGAEPNRFVVVLPVARSVPRRLARRAARHAGPDVDLRSGRSAAGAARGLAAGSAAGRALRRRR